MVYFTKKFIKFYLESKEILSHINAVHAYTPKADEFTGNIVGGVVNKINCSGIIAIASLTTVDLNRPRSSNNKRTIDEYKNTIREILRHINIPNEDGKLIKPYLHLAIHSMRDRDKEIEIGTLQGKTCSPEVKIDLLMKLKNTLTKYK